MRPVPRILKKGGNCVAQAQGLYGPALYFMMLLPAIAVSLALIVYPMCYGFYISLFDTNLVNKWDYVGAGNYLSLLSNKTFQNSLIINLNISFSWFWAM